MGKEWKKEDSVRQVELSATAQKAARQIANEALGDLRQSVEHVKSELRALKKHVKKKNRSNDKKFKAIADVLQDLTKNRRDKKLKKNARWCIETLRAASSSS